MKNAPSSGLTAHGWFGPSALRISVLTGALGGRGASSGAMSANGDLGAATPPTGGTYAPPDGGDPIGRTPGGSAGGAAGSPAPGFTGAGVAGGVTGGVTGADGVTGATGEAGRS